MTNDLIGTPHADDSARPAVAVLLGHYGLPAFNARLIEAHRGQKGDWRIKFCYDDAETLSMETGEASRLAENLHEIGEEALALEIEDAVARAGRYMTM